MLMVAGGSGTATQRSDEARYVSRRGETRVRSGRPIGLANLA